MKIPLRVIISVMVCGAASVWAADRYVSTNGTHDSVGGFVTWVGAATNIQAAVDKAAAGETVWVSNGVYSVAAQNAQVVSITKDLSLRGFGGNPSTVVINGSATNRGVYVNLASQAYVLIDGFTITNCMIGGKGGGVYLKHDGITAGTGVVQNCIITGNSAGNTPAVVDQRGAGGGLCSIGQMTSAFYTVVSNCTISGNTAMSYRYNPGGGAFYWGTRLTMQDCRVVGNVVTSSPAGQCASGGGIGISVFTPGSVIRNCTIESNAISGSGWGAGLEVNQDTAGIGGGAGKEGVLVESCTIRYNNSQYLVGGVYLASGQTNILRNCLISFNMATNSGCYGGGVYVTAPSTNVVENCTIVSNGAGTAGATVSGVHSQSGTTELRNSVVYHNWRIGVPVANIYNAGTLTVNNTCTTPTNVAGVTFGAGNTAVPPAFRDAAGGDFRLKNFSPGVDAGLTQAWMSGAVDLAGQPRISANNLVDMGAYETTYEPLTYYAAHNGQTPVVPYTNWSMAASNIQDAVNQIEDATYQATVWVGAGRYTVPPNAVEYKGTNVVYINKPTTLRSSNSVPESTIIDGGGAYRGIAVDYNYDTVNRFVIDGFTISNGYVAIGATNGGAGILFNSGTYTAVVQNCLICNNTVTSTPATLRTDGGGGLFIQSRPSYSPVYYVISNCTFRGNRVLFNMQTGGGGGAYLITSRGGRIDNCLFEQNSVADGAGGGLLFFGTTAYATNEIRNSVLRNNRQANTSGSAELGGGGIELTYGAVVKMWNCLVYNNTAEGYGGGIYNMKGGSVGRPLDLVNCTVVSNATVQSSAGGIDDRLTTDYISLCNTIVASNKSGSIYITFSDVNCTSNNSTFSYCCIPSTNIGFTNILAVGVGNITNSPRFVNFAAQDFRLSSASPCINTGTNQDWWMTGAADLDGNARISPKLGGTVDMGAYEFPYHFGSIFTVR